MTAYQKLVRPPSATLRAYSDPITPFSLPQDQDYFKAAINEVIHDPVDGVVEHVPGAVIFKVVRSERYSDANEFLREVPKCCKFVAANSGDTGPDVNVWDRLRGVRTV